MNKIALTRALKWYCMLALFFVSALAAHSFVPCEIIDEGAHRTNAALASRIIENLIARCPSNEEKSLFLLSQITSIAKELLEKGFSPRAYNAPISDTSVGYTSFVLWEGKDQNDPVNATFFVYCWPPLSPLEKQIVPMGTAIHSHTIPCALAVLDGALIEEIFQPTSRSQHFATLIQRIKRSPLDANTDLTPPSLIHRIYNGQNQTLSLSLHAYGLPSADAIRSSFKNGVKQHTYYIKGE